MRLWFGVFLALVVFAGVAVPLLIAWPIGEEPKPITLSGDVDRGAYLARASGCIACHTDHGSRGALLAGGPALRTDFGAIHPPNLTTDTNHGIGNWSVEEFAKAVRQGISPEGEPYYPAFTYPFYANFSDQDIADLWAAFQTVAPVPIASPEHELGFPFNQRWGLKLWRTVYLWPPDTGPVPGQTESWNRGRWLVRGAAHCGACHTPRNFAGARLRNQGLAGNDSLPGGGRAPSIRSDDLRSRGWTADDLVFSLRTGVLPDGDVFGESMAEVVNHGTAFLGDADLQAIALYVMNSDAAEE